MSSDPSTPHRRMNMERSNSPSSPACYLTTTLLTDPFDDVEDDPLAVGQDAGTQHYVHIRIQQGDGGKTVTTVDGLPKECDPRKLFKTFKEEFACSDELGQVIQLQGDQRAKITSLLVEQGISCNTIKVNEL